MKYRFSYMPNTQKARVFRVTSPDKKNESVFNISREMIGIWGNPAESKLEQFMVAYIKKHGWPKQPVTVEVKDCSRNLNQAINA